MLHWYVARTKPGKEKVACKNISNQGIRVFLPLFERTIIRVKTFETRLHPVFPGYLFFQSPEDRALWRAVSGSLGVAHVVWGDGRLPRPVPARFMDSLFSSCQEGVMSFGGDQPAVGDSVRVNVGPFAGLLGNIRSLDSNGRVSLLLDVMGSATVQMSITGLEFSNNIKALKG